MPKSFLIDTTRCTACRGCQMACKDWHNLPAIETKQTGTHQNPPDLNPCNYKLVRFHEHKDENGRVVWNFFPDQCRHCIYPVCKDVADMAVPGAIIQDKETGAVLCTKKSAELSYEDEAKSPDNQLYSKVQIMTIHKSKGAEFDYVFLPEITSKAITLQ